MVTLDKKVENVGKFGGDLKAGRRDYERAKQGMDVIFEEKSLLEQALKEYTGFYDLSLPKESTEISIKRGNVEFTITSSTRIKRPAYKEAVMGMEGSMYGIAFLVSQGEEISYVFKDGRLFFIGVPDLFNMYKIIVAGVLEPEVFHLIDHLVTGEIATEGVLDEIVLREGRNPKALTEENFKNYARMNRIETNLVKYVKAYETELTKGQKKPKRTLPVTSRSAYTTTKSKSEGPDWAYVVKTLITVPTEPKLMGELNILNDTLISKAEKERRFPHYQLNYRHEDHEKILYVSIQSVLGRIDSLKESKGVGAKKLIVEPKEIV